MLFKQNSIPNPRKLVSKLQIHQQCLPGQNFTFMEWYRAALKLKSDHPECVCKFISKNETTEMLTECQPGTFMFRISESRLGAYSYYR